MRDTFHGVVFIFARKNGGCIYLPLYSHAHEGFTSCTSQLTAQLILTCTQRQRHPMTPSFGRRPWPCVFEIRGGRDENKKIELARAKNTEKRKTLGPDSRRSVTETAQRHDHRDVTTPQVAAYNNCGVFTVRGVLVGAVRILVRTAPLVLAR